MLEHAGQLARHPVDLLVAQLQPREARDVADLVAIDHREAGTPQKGRSSRSESHAAASTASDPAKASHSP